MTKHGQATAANPECTRAHPSRAIPALDRTIEMPTFIDVVPFIRGRWPRLGDHRVYDDVTRSSRESSVQWSRGGHADRPD
jgi:hypothetical protein